MILKFLIIFLTIYLPQLVFCQQGWYQLTSGTNQSFSSVYFTSADTGYVAGENGRILRTTNGGLNWVTQTSGTTNGLGSIYFVNNSTGYIVGGANNQSTILKTSNGGLNWFQQLPGTNNPLGSVYFADLNTGYAVGSYTIVKTTNGGINWFFQSANYGLTSVYFTDPNTGYVTENNGRIIKTVNGGFSWSTLVSNTTLYLRSVFFPNASTGYIAGGGLIFPNVWRIILKTTDSGNTWINQMFSGTELYTIHFNNVDTGYAAGENGRILKTTNGGVNWISQISNTGSYLTEIFFYDLNTGYCVGGYGTILKTTNGGVSGIISISNEIPSEYKLFQNYPNPFNPSSKIKFQISKLSDVKLNVFDIRGREIIILVNEVLKPGTYKAEISGENYPSGIYFYRLQTEKYNQTLKMSLIK